MSDQPQLTFDQAFDPEIKPITRIGVKAWVWTRGAGDAEYEIHAFEHLSNEGPANYSLCKVQRGHYNWFDTAQLTGEYPRCKACAEVLVKTLLEGEKDGNTRAP